MRNWKLGLAALSTAGLCALLSGCGAVDESILSTQANYSVEINMPYATATPLPDYRNVPDAIVIDTDGNVTINDASVIEGDFQSVRDQEAQTEYRSLSLGNTGIAVQALQARLKELGYFSGDVSGLFDAETEAAVRRFEQTYGTMQTGVATAKLQLKLFAANAPVYGSEEYDEAVVSQYTVLRPGAVGSSVYALQQRLKNLGYPITDLTGVYDDQTIRCVRMFCRAYNLAASDVANVSLQKELYADTAKPYDPAYEMALGPVAPDAVEQTLQDIPEDDDYDETTTLTLGSSGSRVSQAQQRLIALGYLAEGGDTGVFDAATQDAVNRFLEAVGRVPSGMLSRDMMVFLLSDRAPAYGSTPIVSEYKDLNVGDSGPAVMALQRRLVELGYANGTPNGRYANATISAVKFYQECNGMEPDGIATAYLQAVLFSDLALTYEQTQQGVEGFDMLQQAESEVPEVATPEPSATPEPTPTPPPRAQEVIYFNLAQGATGNAVLSLQERLTALKYMNGASGVYDEDTVAAVCEFQAALCIPQTGEASASLQRYLYSKAAPGPSVRFHSQEYDFQSLQQGDEGDAVEQLQKRLYDLGLLKRDDVEGSVGVFNEGTRLAVIDAQLKMGYPSADGVASPEFQSFLYSKYGTKLKA